MSQQRDHLVRMANQIAANVAGGGDIETTARRVADHLCRFWTSDMCNQLVEYRSESDSELSAAVVKALELLSQDGLA